MILTKEYIAENGDRYVDKKRWLWTLSVLVPLLTLVGPLLHAIFNNEALLFVPAVIFYVVIPLLDHVIGEDSNNPPESIVNQLDSDLYYRVITFILVPMLVASFVFAAWYAMTFPLSVLGKIAMVLVSGFICGYAINLGHEMGHKKSLWERWAAKIALSLSAYGHFNVEHNRGHHVWVATPEDGASSQMGESIYRFYCREYPGAFIRAWQLEKERLARRELSVWSLDNEVVQSVLLTLGFYGVLAIWLGPAVLLFLLAVAVWGGFQLTSANYIEHYGLKRKKLPNGRYERCQPKHSWNSNYLLSNWTLLHLQRHSDHHANPMRRFQSLRNFEHIPQLPAGYYTMFLVAYVPAIWFRVMDQRAFEAVDQDMDSLNILPSKLEHYSQKFVATSLSQ
ncbi:MAG: alkane 1-monooxygenase [Gammaproteobacteria bacterium]|nr:alkane 1-monooxygenase [Gammaproteobacteria bacterium]